MSSKSHFFRGGINLIADYEFNNNLIDSVGGNNLIGTDITFNNNNVVFNLPTSEASKTDLNDIFSFTNNVNDLPFKIETSVKPNSFGNFNFIASKRGVNNNTQVEWQLYFSGNRLAFFLASNGNLSNRIVITSDVLSNTNVFTDIVVEYNGRGINGLELFVDGIKATNKNTFGTYLKMVQTDVNFIVGNFSINNSVTFDGEINYLKIYK